MSNEFAFLPMDSAPTDGTPILSRTTDSAFPAAEYCGRFVVIRSLGINRSGHDTGWIGDYPLADGEGFQTSQLVGWLPLPAKEAGVSDSRVARVVEAIREEIERQNEPEKARWGSDIIYSSNEDAEGMTLCIDGAVNMTLVAEAVLRALDEAAQ